MLAGCPSIVAGYLNVYARKPSVRDLNSWMSTVNAHFVCTLYNARHRQISSMAQNMRQSLARQPPATSTARDGK